MIPLMVLLSCRGGFTNAGDNVEHTHVALVDDFQPRGPNGEDLGRSRLDTAREYVGNINNDANNPILNAGQPLGGVRYELPVSPGQIETGFQLDQILGPALIYDVQPTLAGLSVRLDGNGAITARLEGPEGEEVWTATKDIPRSDDEVLFAIDANPVSRVSTLVIELERGFAELRRVELLLKERRPYADTFEEAFVYSFAQLSRCYDDNVDLVRARCTLEPEDAVYGTDVSGLYALAAAVGADLGLVNEVVARTIVTDVRDALLALPRDPTAGLLPETTDGTDVAPGGNWSSLSTAIAIESTMLAAQFFELRLDDLQGVLEDIEWDELTNNGNRAVLAGYSANGVELGFTYGVFGSKSVLLQIPHVRATDEFYRMSEAFTPTWDGTGWDNELAALLFPMDGTDWIGNDWTKWRTGSHWQHHTWSRDTIAGDDFGFFGLSTCEVPEPWLIEQLTDPVGVWGIGGHNKIATDGLNEVGYSFFAPHYPAMTSGNVPETANAMFTTLLERELLTPYNAVESVGLAELDVVRYNHRLRAWSLALQTLGLGRAVAGEGYLPYRLLDTIAFLRDGHQLVLPGAPE